MESLVNTCKEMLAQRGHSDIKSDDEKIYSGEICIFLHIVDKLNVSKIQEYIEMCKKLKFKHVIIVYNKVVTPVALKVSRNVKTVTIELFKTRELLFNVTKHRLVPCHERVVCPKTLAQLSKYNLPKLSSDDVVARFFRFRPGDVVKITRDDCIVFRRVS